MNFDGTNESRSESERIFRTTIDDRFATVINLPSDHFQDFVEGSRFTELENSPGMKHNLIMNY